MALGFDNNNAPNVGVESDFFASNSNFDLYIT